MKHVATPRKIGCISAARLLNTGFFPAAVLLITVSFGAAPVVAQKKAGSTAGAACVGDDGGITLPPGFCATVFADNLGHARHMTFGPNGVLYVNTWSGRYYHDEPPPPGGFLIALRHQR